MVKLLSFICYGFLLCACERASERSELKEIPRQNDNAIPLKQSIGIDSTVSAQKHVGDIYNVEKTFIYEDENTKQVLIVNYKPKYIVEFHYIIENKGGACSIDKIGRAINRHPDNDPEIDEDEDSVAYYAYEYRYDERASGLALRIDGKDTNKAYVHSYGYEGTCIPEWSKLLKLKR